MVEPLIRDTYRLLINRVDCYLTWYDRWVLRRAPLNKDVLTKALHGDMHLGIQAVSGAGMSRWTCLDADEDRLFASLAELALSLPTESRLLERSRRGGHLWLFHSLVDWQTAHDRGVALAASVGLGDIEVYPKYCGVHAVRMIGTRHPKTGLIYPIVEPSTGEMLDLPSALSGIAPTRLECSPTSSMPAPISVSRSPEHANEDFEVLAGLLGQLTELKIYAPFKASGRCPWHDDGSPSLYVKGRRFHCLACGAWGDAPDVRRFINKGIRPPS
jgi:hypothetical protein